MKTCQALVLENENFVEKNGLNSSLVNTTEICQPPPSGEIVENAIKERYLLRSKAQNFIRKNKIKSRLFKCGVYTLPAHRRCTKTGLKIKTPFSGEVETHAYNSEELETTKYGLVGLEFCKNAFWCPVCGPKLLQAKASQIIEVGNVMIERGFKVAFQTITAPHTFQDLPNEFVKKFQEANRHLKQKPSYKRWANKWGVKYYIRGAECTVDDYSVVASRSGAHWHTHTVLFSERDRAYTELEIKKMRDELAALLVQSYVKYGLVKNTIEAQAKAYKICVDMRAPWVAKDGYLTTDTKIEKLASYITKGLSFELASNYTKEGKKKGRISHFALFKRTVESENPNVKDVQVLKWLFEAFRGRSKIYFSPGLLAFCGLKEIDEDMLLRKEKGNEIIHSQSPNSVVWRGTTKRGLQRHVISFLNGLKSVEDAKEVVGDAFKLASQGVDVSRLEKHEVLLN